MMPETLISLAAALAVSVLPTPPGATTDLSVMSYNVHGLPWPITRGRPRALKAIGERLAEMRVRGDQPRLVLLQEAFSHDARAISREAGYRYVVSGPGRNARPLPIADRASASPARRDEKLRGEGDGTFESSGLLVLSDYPIVDVRRMPFERRSCAGYDCLANKGIVLVRVAVPGFAQPLTVIDTHMNSRGSSGVGQARADAAYGWQAVQLRAFVANNVPANAPAIVAGDFNIGKAGYRRAMIVGGGGVLTGGADALRTALDEHLDFADQGAAEAIVDRGKDWMFARSGCSTRLRLKSVQVPFGREPDGKSLSDHFGYTARYGIENSPGGCSPAVD